jgi:hypothetical protein
LGIIHAKDLDFSGIRRRAPFARRTARGKLEKVMIEEPYAPLEAT